MNGIVGFLGVKSEYTILITHTHLRNVICTFFNEITISFRGCRTGMRTILLTTTSVVCNTPALYTLSRNGLVIAALCTRSDSAFAVTGVKSHRRDNTMRLILNLIVDSFVSTYSGYCLHFSKVGNDFKLQRNKKKKACHCSGLG